MTKLYDPATLYHWLFWQLRCFKASPMEFQHLFEEVAKRAHMQFVPIRPHGKLGDRKADGLYFGEGTVFQVYAPDDMTRAKLLKKIKEDLEGAAKEWGDDLKEWVFVYNVRRGVPADVPKILKAEARRYPLIAVRCLSNDSLWTIVRDLPVQDRVEILGPSPELEELFPLAATLPSVVQDRLRTGKFVIVQDTLSPINIQDALAAIAPAQALGPPLYLPRWTMETAWELAADHQHGLVEAAMERSRELLPRFAVFSLAPIPLAIHLGFLFSDRVEVEPFQFDRDRRTWVWDNNVTHPDKSFLVHGLPNAPRPIGPVEAALRVSISDRVTPEQTAATVGRLPIEVDLVVPHPDVTWLKHPDQLVGFAQAFRGTLKAIREASPNCGRVHLFFAGPTGAAIVAGQTINPRMNPPVVLYEYDRRKEPHYTSVLTLR